MLQTSLNRVLNSRSYQPLISFSSLLPTKFNRTMVSTASDRFLADKAPPICRVEVAKSFSQLTLKEKLYAHYVGQASWAGARIIQEQWTPQALKLYDLLILTFSSNEKLADLDALRQKSGISSEDFEQVLQYSSQVLHNLVYYKASVSRRSYLAFPKQNLLLWSRSQLMQPLLSPAMHQCYPKIHCYVIAPIGPE
ncbi:hypothetical protein BDR07DRAFT_909469 [Suillus spraguei]|nr:hypothetical protein BDR07DRAFT_909469 [Suillus spraguei]